jgi:ATP synthase protein I
MAEPQRGEKDPDDSGLGSTARQMQAAQPWIAAAWKLIGGAVVGMLGGLGVDRWFPAVKPWGTVVLSLTGISVGFYALIREVMRMGKK